MIKSIEQTYGAGAVDFQKARYDSLRDEFE